MNIMSYIDPATTAIIWQVLAGIFIALAVVFGIWWRKITTFIRSVWFKIFGKKTKEGENAADNEALNEIDEETADITYTADTGEASDTEIEGK